MYKTLPVAEDEWALDSGGFSELTMYGKWQTSASQYIDEVQRFQEQVGNLNWVAPQDWMCEPWLLAKTGLSIAEHQAMTTASVIELRKAGLPVIPVLQGWELADYHSHKTQYAAVGIDLEAEETVGIGSVCRRQATDEIGEIVRSLQGIKMHGFGVKINGLAKYGQYLHSADSMAWSFSARREEPLEGHEPWHINCANCIDYAVMWRNRIVGVANAT